MRGPAAKTKHYQGLARYYTNWAIQKKLNAVVHLEDKTDKKFWGTLFKNYFPKGKFRFIPYSRNQRGNNTSGCQQCLSFRDFLNKHFVVCVDSDYRNLMQLEKVNIRQYIFQTYTYSFENHLCFARGLSAVCEESCGFENRYFNFERFFHSFSTIIYPLFVWHLALYRSRRSTFSIAEFNKTVFSGHFSFKDVPIQGEQYLNTLSSHVKERLKELHTLYPDFDLTVQKEVMSRVGVTKENAYLYIRGHNLFSFCTAVEKEVCRFILRKNRSNSPYPAEVEPYNKYKFKEAIYQNIQIGAYPQIAKIGEDMKEYARFFQQHGQ